MKTGKRLIIATLCGVITGLACFGLASSGKAELPWPAAVQIILSRTLIGFSIGISAVSIVHWSLNGLVMGVIYSLPLAFGVLMAPDNPEFSRSMLFTSTIVLGAVYGIFIELVTTVVFKAEAGD
ncbi:MAG: hypothetical protein MUD12_07645 [Spirochaetes bacterium]|jgi:hypothetical protein|nr:hypothetical protein [Spirochaetota bacterium]